MSGKELMGEGNSAGGIVLFSDLGGGYFRIFKKYYRFTGRCKDTKIVQKVLNMLHQVSPNSYILNDYSTNWHWYNVQI